MKKKLIKIIVSFLTVAIFCSTVYAALVLFASKSVNSDFTKKRIFEFNLNSGLSSTEVGPGDSCDINPYIFNSSSEEMYVFIKIMMPKYNDEFLYSFEASENWQLVSEDDDGLVYAYGSDELTKLIPGLETESLTDKITFQDITNAEFYELSDINISIVGYAISAEENYNSMVDAWNTCKLLIEE